MQQYAISASVQKGGRALAQAKQSEIRFDAAAQQDPDLPGPADLLATAFAACVLKNVERFSHILPFQYETASIHVEAQREDRPPRIVSIRYTLRIKTDEPRHRVDQLHLNIRKYGTIYNTLAAACRVEGDIIADNPAMIGDKDGNAQRSRS
jgi:uncharacterized OsmC-like protein